VRDVFHVS
jgi:hypothetical protein